MYRRQIIAHGETITLRRNNPSPNPPTDADVSARVSGFDPEELTGTIQQGDRRVIVLAEDVEAAGWPAPPKRNDKVILRGRTLNVETVDDSTRRIGGTLIAYDLVVRG